MSTALAGVGSRVISAHRTTAGEHFSTRSEPALGLQVTRIVGSIDQVNLFTNRLAKRRHLRSRNDL